MEIPLYQIDAFASELFQGNPAAVCPLNEWLPDDLMQLIASENNLSETAFFVPVGDRFHIRWFTPVSEVDLCGHATLAAAYVLFTNLGYDRERIAFDSRSGILSVSRDSDWLTLDFPAQPPVSCSIPNEIAQAFHVIPIECLRSEDYIVVFEHEDHIEQADPDYLHLMKLDLRGVSMTSRSRRWDFVARFFAPKFGVFEDPVTGSAFTQLAPYWAEKLSKQQFAARQVSARGGDVRCEIVGDRVLISGKAVTYLEGTFRIPEK